MPRNGSGTFNRLYSWEQDAANNIKIRADRMDAEMDGMATALSNSIAVDGQTAITANLPMSGFKHTGAAPATEDGEYLAFDQIVTTIDDDSPSATSIPSESAITSYFATRSGNVFNVLNYISRVASGPTEVDKIIAGDYATQDASVVTEGVQDAFVAWYESGAAGTVYFPPGSYLMNDEMTAGTTSGGKTVAEHIKDGDLGGAEPPHTFGVMGEYKQSWIVVDETFSSSDTNFIDKVVLRYEDTSRSLNSPVIVGMNFYADISRANRKKCPVALKATGHNFSLIKDIIVRGATWEWYNTGIHIEEMNNSYCQNWRVKAGFQHTVADMYADGGGGRFDLTQTNRIDTNDGSSPFAPPAGEDRTWWNDKWLLLGQGASDNAETVVVKTRSVDANFNDSTLWLDSSWEAPKTSSGINISFELLYGGMTAGSNTLTLERGVLDSDDEGRMVHVMRVGSDLDSSRGILSAYIQPGSISGDGTSCSLVASDGTTVANAGETRSRQHVLFGPGIYIGQSIDFMTSGGNNNDITFIGIHAENCRGGAQMLLENVNGSHFLSGKAHGRLGSASDFQQQFSETGYLVAFDSCDDTSMENFLFTHTNALDGNNENVSSFRWLGERNHIKFDKYRFFGCSDKARLWLLSGIGTDHLVVMGDGFNNISGWETAANDRGLFSGFASHQIEANGSLKLRETASTAGYTDLLGVYRKNRFTPQVATISSGEIDVTGSMVRVETEGGASTDDLDTINGLLQGQTLFISQETGANSVVLKHGTGNMILPGGTDITLDQTRDVLQLVRYENSIFVVSSPSDV